jgi:hypothetical protein
VKTSLHRAGRGVRWVWSGRRLILVDEAAEYLGAPDAVPGRDHWRCLGGSRGLERSLVSGLVGAVPVVVVGVGVQNALQALLVEDEQAVGALAEDGADPAFGEGVRLR